MGHIKKHLYLAHEKFWVGLLYLILSNILELKQQLSIYSLLLEFVFGDEIYSNTYNNCRDPGFDTRGERFRVNMFLITSAI